MKIKRDGDFYYSNDVVSQTKTKNTFSGQYIVL